MDIRLFPALEGGYRWAGRDRSLMQRCRRRLLLGLALIDAGHFNMERAAMHAFADDLRNRFRDLNWDVVVEIFEDEKAPMRYMSREA